QLIVAEEFPDGSMQVIGAGLNRRVEHRRARSTEFRAEAGSLYFEFLNGINRWQNHVICAVQEVYGVGIIVNPVEHVVVLRGPQAIGRKRSGGGITACIGLWRINSRNYLRQEREISSVQRN